MIICAALLVELEVAKEKVVIPCFRHGTGYEMLNTMLVKSKYKVVEEGFITHENIFLNRREAFAEARLCGQLSQANKWYKEDNYESELYSEDLY